MPNYIFKRTRKSSAPLKMALDGIQMDAPAYIERILSIRDASLRKSGHFDYGANVLPVIQHYATLKDAAERKQFQDALEFMLESDNAEWRKYAVTLCLGFFAFRDAV